MKDKTSNSLTRMKDSAVLLNSAQASSTSHNPKSPCYTIRWSVPFLTCKTQPNSLLAWVSIDKSKLQSRLILASSNLRRFYDACWTIFLSIHRRYTEADNVAHIFDGWRWISAAFRRNFFHFIAHAIGWPCSQNGYPIL